MGKYILRRLIIALPSLLGISLILFVLLALAPGDPFGGKTPPEDTGTPQPSLKRSRNEEAHFSVRLGLKATRNG